MKSRVNGHCTTSILRCNLSYFLASTFTTCLLRRNTDIRPEPILSQSAHGIVDGFADAQTSTRGALLWYTAPASSTFRSSKGWFSCRGF
jgi:hypothetical protein